MKSETIVLLIKGRRMKPTEYIILAISIIFVLLFTSIELISVLKPIYNKEYIANNVYEVNYVKNYPVDYVTDDIILYLSDVIDDMNQRDYFENRENIHMIDVKVLFDLGKIIRLICIIFISFILSKLSEEKEFVKKYRITYIGVLFLISFIAIVISRNFSVAFVKFHHIFFNNDNWILDPSESIIINLMPERFFVNLSIYIIATFIVLNILHHILISKLCKAHNF